MRFHGGSWHNLQLKGSPLLLCYSSFVPALIPEELVCHGEENPTQSVYCLSSFFMSCLWTCPVRRRWEGSFRVALLMDAGVKMIFYLSAGFKWVASRGPWPIKLEFLFTGWDVQCWQHGQPRRWELLSSGESWVSSQQVKPFFSTVVILVPRKWQIRDEFLKIRFKKILKSDLDVLKNCSEIMSLHLEHQLRWRLKLSLCTDPL